MYKNICTWQLKKKKLSIAFENKEILLMKFWRNIDYESHMLFVKCQLDWSEDSDVITTGIFRV